MMRLLAFAVAAASVAVSTAADVDTCPGYTASKVVTKGSSLTADLTLAGAACNAYGEDIQKLKLQVDYETGV
jgi:alpha-glucosidase